LAPRRAKKASASISRSTARRPTATARERFCCSTGGLNDDAPHPALRATLSRWERGRTNFCPSPIGRRCRAAADEGDAMKLVVAIIRPERLHNVLESLFRANV